MDVLDIFPANGLDRSIMTPVVIGVGFMALASETLGWPFAGLVVPGYLASIFSIAPVTGAAIVGESFLAYFLARAVGVWLPFLDTWSQFFGRERFFLMIASSLVVRIFSEGYALPWLATRYEFAHASELYSIGLVLIPLVANSAWNTGLYRGVVQAVITSLATYLVLQYLLVPYTNLSLSKVELTFERIALDFFSSPKAYLVLLVGTIAGARCNVLYGWDYNGILVPGLLAVAWYQPTKLLATLIEATVVVVLSQKLVLTRLFAGKLIEGPRRLVLVFTVGFLLKIALGFLLMGVWPGATATDFYGFGYVLPTLLSMKMWQYRSIPHVLMPTLTVSLIGFLGGNAIGMAMHFLWPPTFEDPIGVPLVDRGPLPLEIALQAELPEHGTPRFLEGERLALIADVAREFAVHDRSEALEKAAAGNVELFRYDDPELGDLYAVRDDRAGSYTPGFVMRTRGAGGLVVRGDDTLAMAAAAMTLGQALDAAYWLIVPTRAAGFDAWFSRLEPNLPAGELRTVTVGRTLDVEHANEAERRALRTRGFSLSAEDVMSLDEARTSAWLGSAFQVPEEAERLTWGELEDALPALPITASDTSRVSRARTRFMSAKLVPALDGWADGQELSPKDLALIDMLGFSRHRVDGLAGEALALVSRTALSPGAQLVWVVRRTEDKLVVSVPFAQEQRATPKVGRPFARSLPVRHFLMSETRPPRSREGVIRNVIRRTYIERILEALLARDARILSVHVVARGQGLEQTDMVVSSSRDLAELPDFVEPALAQLADAEVAVKVYTSDRATAFARGSGHPIMEYGRALYPDRVAAFWLTERLRQRFVESELQRLPEWLQQAGARRVRGELDALVMDLPNLGACDEDAVRAALVRVHESWNPYHARDALTQASGCAPFVVDDAVSGMSYLVGASVNDRWVLTLENPPGATPYEVSSQARLRTAADYGQRWIRVMPEAVVPEAQPP